MAHRSGEPPPPGRAAPRRARAAAVTVTAALAAVGILVSTGPAQAAPARTGTAQQTGGLRCQGKGVDPDAVIRYRSDIDQGSAEHRLQAADRRRGPAVAAGTGPLRAGSQFRWTTPAPATPSTPETTLNITSTVRQLDRSSCIRWSGPAVGEGLRIDEGVHVWNFTKVKGGVRVRTGETWTGDQVEADAPLATAMLGAELEEWLRELKTTAEARSGGPCA
ncbi:hypothetical protein GCM10010372_27600 [Streptomyces tauricus]|nr:hypothetical protein GCM10010372_27600 [Streptomyces tauricus]